MICVPWQKCTSWIRVHKTSVYHASPRGGKVQVTTERVIQSQSIKFDTGVENKATSDQELNDTSVDNPQQCVCARLQCLGCHQAAIFLAASEN